MALYVRGLPSLVIPNGTSTSNALGQILEDSWGLTIYTPAALTGTISVEVEPTDTGTNFVTLQSGGTDVTLPAGKATVINPIPFRQIRVTSNAAEGAARTFTLTKSVLI